MCTGNTGVGHAVHGDADIWAGIYTFDPLFKEQQKAQENWKNPGYGTTYCAVLRSKTACEFWKLIWSGLVKPKQTLLPGLRGPTRMRHIRRTDRLVRQRKSENIGSPLSTTVHLQLPSSTGTVHPDVGPVPTEQQVEYTCTVYCVCQARHRQLKTWFAEVTSHIPYPWIASMFPHSPSTFNIHNYFERCKSWGKDTMRHSTHRMGLNWIELN